MRRDRSRDSCTTSSRTRGSHENDHLLTASACLVIHRRKQSCRAQGEIAITPIPGIIAAGARFTQVFQTVGNNVDGIVAAVDGSLLASQEDNNAVLKIDKDDRASVYLAGVAVGSLSIDRQGRLFAVRRIAQPHARVTQPSGRRRPRVDVMPEVRVGPMADGRR